MPKRSSKDVNKIAHLIVERIGKRESASAPKKKNPAAVSLGRLGGLKGGKARAEKLSAEQRSDIARLAAQTRWEAKGQMATPAPLPQRPTKSIPATANQFIEQQLDERLMAIEKEFDADGLNICGPLYSGVDDIVRKVVENKRKRSKRENLVVILTTEGGYIEPVQRMVATLRVHYKLVDFVVPNHAYSAGTVFVMAGDAIHMDYYSRLGPIDPQIETPQGLMVSALGQLEKYNALILKAQKGTITTAEVQLLLAFDQAELYHYEQARDMSIEMLKEWLVKYKFKNWTKTATRKLAVTMGMKKGRAALIGKILNNTKRWHSHGYGISMEVLERDLKLQIDDYEKQSARCEAIRGYHDLLSDYMSKRSARGVVHMPGSYRPYM